jgi:hypothetical protein
MTIPRKVKIVLAILGVFAVLFLWQWISYLFKAGFSKGTRTGIVRKVSVKGPPYCKYLEGEMILQGTMIQGEAPFEFSVDDADDKNPIVQKLKQAERDGVRATLDYRWDRAKDIWWYCNPNEYYITNVTLHSPEQPKAPPAPPAEQPKK